MDRNITKPDLVLLVQRDDVNAVMVALINGADAAAAEAAIFIKAFSGYTLQV